MYNDYILTVGREFFERSPAERRRLVRPFDLFNDPLPTLPRIDTEHRYIACAVFSKMPRAKAIERPNFDDHSILRNRLGKFDSSVELGVTHLSRN